MKKVLFVLAFVAAYGVSMAMSNTVDIQETQVVLVADVANDDIVSPEGDKEGEKTAVAAKTPAKAEGCSSAKAEGCSTAKAEGCSTAKTAAKAEGCSGSKTAAKAKSGCSSSCGSSKTAQK